jgi:DNA-binding YbaB/EbfC family protein
MQESIQQKQAELEETEFTVKGAGGMVEVTMRGDYNVTAMKINSDVVDPEDVEMLEDIVAAAVNEAVRTVKETTENEMAQISGGFNMPGMPGMGM